VVVSLPVKRLRKRVAVAGVLEAVFTSWLLVLRRLCL
jgi:hypothetical protein